MALPGNLGVDGFLVSSYSTTGTTSWGVLFRLPSLRGPQTRKDTMEKSYESDPRLKLDQLSLEDLLAHITKTLTPKDRLQIFQSHETMMAVLKKYQEQALTIAAVLLTEQENLLWLNKDLQASAVINKAAYKTPFSQALALKAASTIPSPFTETTRLLCFESVLYAAYLGCLLSSEE